MSQRRVHTLLRELAHRLGSGVCHRFLTLLWLATSPAVQGAKNPTLAWPPPPAQPYIAYVQSISGPADIGAKPPALKRFANWVSGTPQQNTLVKPFGLALDQAGNLLITDTGANSVCWLDRLNKKWVRWEGAGDQRFQCPVAAARRGNIIYVADSTLGKVLALDDQGRSFLEITRDLERPAGLTIQGEKLFIADSQRHQIVVFNLRGEYLSKFGRRGNRWDEFNYPTHINTDAVGQLYVTDSMNYRVEVLDPSGRCLRVIGSVGDRPGNFSRPKGSAVDLAGHLYVVDALFDAVQIFDDQNRLLLSWGESGSAPGQFWMPNGIVISPKNEIYVADSYNHRVQVFQYTGKQ